MTNPADIGAGFLAKLKLIPALVTEMGGDDSRIIFYEDNFPGAASKAFAIGQMVAPEILLTYEGTSPAPFGPSSVWKHHFALVMRPLGKATTLWYQIVQGIPTGSALPLLYVEPHAAVDSMDVPSVQRNSLQVSDGAVIDYYEAQIVFTEKGP